MPDLIAQSADATHFWRHPLGLYESFVIGRHTAEAAVPWDTQISRAHARASWDGRHLRVERIDEAKNPIYLQGIATDEFTLEIGERFVIGQTTFLLVASVDELTESRPTPFAIQALRRSEIQAQRFHEAAQRIDALARLPRLISPANSDAELARRVAQLLLDGIAKASATAVIEYSPHADGQHTILHGESRGIAAHRFQPSFRLLRHVRDTGEGTLHLWDASCMSDVGVTATQHAGVDWAFCLPVGGEAHPWFLYVEGATAKHETACQSGAFEDDIKFTEIVSTTLGNLRTAQTWERRHARIRPFFSPQVLKWIDQTSSGTLEPRQAEISVMFCDLRGFSRESELSADDLLALLRRVGRSLGVMTTEILQAGGVIGDFHGDAAMGFWGWPLQTPTQVADACQAALRIRSRLADPSPTAADPLPVFRAGLGLASGEAVAGPIGTADQLKVTVFGPVVNRAARLESLTKVLKATVLLDQATADQLQPTTPNQRWRTRRLGKIELPRMGRVETVYELLPPAHERDDLPEEAVVSFEAAVAAFEAGNWDEAYELFHQVPHSDQTKDYYVGQIVTRQRQAPDGWDGILRIV